MAVDDLEEWTLSDDPFVEIGMLEGEREYEFHDIIDVARLASGGILVADGGTNELRLYDSEGDHRWTAGGTGDAPGEFGQLASLDRRPDDSVVAFDRDNQRVSIFGPSGDYLDSWSLESLGRGFFPDRVAALDDGSIIVTYIRGHMPGDGDGVIRQAGLVTRYEEDGRLVDDDVAEVEGDEWYRWEGDGGGLLMDRPFGNTGHAEVRDSLLYLGDTAQETVRVLRPDGEVLRELELLGEPQEVTGEHIAEFEAEHLDGTEGDRRAMREAAQEELPYPETMPWYQSMLVDVRGNVWLEEYAPHAVEFSKWQVIDPTGDGLARVRTPAGFRPKWVGDEEVVGVFADELEVEYVQAYGLRR